MKGPPYWLKLAGDQEGVSVGFPPPEMPYTISFNTLRQMVLDLKLAGYSESLIKTAVQACCHNHSEMWDEVVEALL